MEIEELERRLNDGMNLVQSDDGPNNELYEQKKAKWVSVKENVLSEDEKYESLMGHLVGFTESERDVSGWLKKAEEVVASVENIEDGENVEQLFETLEVIINYTVTVTVTGTTKVAQQEQQQQQQQQHRRHFQQHHKQQQQHEQQQQRQVSLKENIHCCSCNSIFCSQSLNSKKAS